MKVGIHDFTVSAFQCFVVILRADV